MSDTGTVEITITAKDRSTPVYERIMRDHAAWCYIWRRRNGHPCKYQLEKHTLWSKIKSAARRVASRP